MTKRQTKRQYRLDRIAMEQGWTHRQKRKSRDPYLIFQKEEVHTLAHQIRPINIGGAIYVDMDQKFRWIADEEVVEL